MGAVKIVDIRTKKEYAKPSHPWLGARVRIIKSSVTLWFPWFESSENHIGEVGTIELTHQDSSTKEMMYFIIFKKKGIVSICAYFEGDFVLL